MVKPYDNEINRYIFGFNDDNETFVLGDENLSIQIHKYIQEKMKLWNYYSNVNRPNEAKWGSGLFRYVDDEGVYDFSYDFINKFLIGKDSEKGK